jgi:HPt (histidine-containing phosphotransfer) domain-containing protein
MGFMDAHGCGGGTGIKEKLRLAEGVDYDVAVTRLTGNETLYCELVKMFFEEDFLGRLRDALEASDERAAVLYAHSLKGTAANLGLNGLSSGAAKVEYELRAGGFANAKTGFFALEKEYGELRARLL